MAPPINKQKKTTSQFGLNDTAQTQTQPPVQQQQQPDFMGMMQLIQQQNMNMLKQAQTPVSRISKDQGTQRGTPGLDQWHRNNPGAPAAGTYQPDGQYGQVGQDVYVGPAPQPQAQAPQQPGLLQTVGDAFRNLFQGGGQQQQQQPQVQTVMPQVQPSSPQPQRDPQIQNLMDLGTLLGDYRQNNYTGQTPIQSFGVDPVTDGGDQGFDANRIPSWRPGQQVGQPQAQPQPTPIVGTTQSYPPMRPNNVQPPKELNTVKGFNQQIKPKTRIQNSRDQWKDPIPNDKGWGADMFRWLSKPNI